VCVYVYVRVCVYSADPNRTRIEPGPSLGTLATAHADDRIDRSIDHVMMMTMTATTPTMPTTRLAPRAGKTTTRTQVRA